MFRFRNKRLQIAVCKRWLTLRCVLRVSDRFQVRNNVVFSVGIK